MNDVKGLFGSFNNKTLNNYSPPPIKMLPIIDPSTELKENDIIYNDNEYKQYKTGMNLTGTIYKVSSQFPIIAEFINNTSLVDPFVKNYSNFTYYNTAKTFYNTGQTSPPIIELFYSIPDTVNELIKNNIQMPSIEIKKNCKLSFVNKVYCENLEYPIDISQIDTVNITFIIPAIINNHELELNEINDIFISLIAVSDKCLYTLHNVSIDKLHIGSIVRITAHFNPEDDISCVSEFRYIVKMNPINVHIIPCINKLTNSYNSTSYISIIRES